MYTSISRGELTWSGNRVYLKDNERQTGWICAAVVNGDQYEISDWLRFDEPLRDLVNLTCQFIIEKSGKA